MITDSITKFVTAELEHEPDLFLVDVILKGNPGNQKLIVLIDGDHGINIDICASLSRKIGNYIEDHQLIDSKYLLEVSSPGLEHPIGTDRQYQKNIGRNVRVMLLSGEQIEGILDSVSGDHIIVISDSNQLVIKKIEINQTKVLVSFK